MGNLCVTHIHIFSLTKPFFCFFKFYLLKFIPASLNVFNSSLLGAASSFTIPIFFLFVITSAILTSIAANSFWSASVSYSIIATSFWICEGSICSTCGASSWV